MQFSVYGGVEIYRGAVAMETLLDYALLYAYFAAYFFHWK